jgi:putative flippase GtrA
MMRFLVVGGVGFVMNYMLLTIIYHWLKFPALPSQAFSAEVVLLATFVGNNFWSFTGHHHISIKRKLIKYNLTSGVGLLLNIITFTLLLKYAHLYYGLALVGGTLAGLVWNYTFNIKVVFKQHAVKVD